MPSVEALNINNRNIQPYDNAIYGSSIDLYWGRKAPFNLSTTAELISPKEEACEEKPWGAFGQPFFMKEMRGPSGEKIKKIVGVSMAYPYGITGEMQEKISQLTLQIEHPNIGKWHGEKEGMLREAHTDWDGNIDDLAILERFVSVSGEVMKEHPNQENEYVKNFFNLQKIREAFLSFLKQDVRRLLQAPFLTGHSAFDPRYRQKGLYVVEMMLNEKGELTGIDPYGEPRPLIEVAADEPHMNWILRLREVARMPGSRLLFHADDTETVSGCGGEDEEVCADFFDLMEGKLANEKTLFRNVSYEDFQVKPTLQASGFGSEQELCDSCGDAKHKGECPTQDSDTASE